MKKYTSKIIIIAIALFLIAFTIHFFIISSKIKKEMKQSNTTELTINH